MPCFQHQASKKYDMKNKQDTTTDSKSKAAEPGFSAQDFEQGRGGMQGGHDTTTESENFTQFQNAGNAGYAAQPTANSVAGANKSVKK